MSAAEAYSSRQQLMFGVQRSPCWPALPGTYIGGLTFIVTAGLPVTESDSHEAPGGRRQCVLLCCFRAERRHGKLHVCSY